MAQIHIRFGGPGRKVALAASVVFVAACTEQETTAAAPPVRPAKLVEISTQANVQTLNFPAVITARSSAKLGESISTPLSNNIEG